MEDNQAQFWLLTTLVIIVFMTLFLWVAGYDAEKYAPRQKAACKSDADCAMGYYCDEVSRSCKERQMLDL